MKFNMHCSEEGKKKKVKKMDPTAKMDLLLNKYLEKELPYADLDNVENLSFVFTYKNTAALVKHSKTLTWLTRWLIGLTIGLIGLTIAPLIIGLL